VSTTNNAKATHQLNLHAPQDRRQLQHAAQPQPVNVCARVSVQAEAAEVAEVERELAEHLATDAEHVVRLLLHSHAGALHTAAVTVVHAEAKHALLRARERAARSRALKAAVGAALERVVQVRWERERGWSCCCLRELRVAPRRGYALRPGRTQRVLKNTSGKPPPPA
jgi:hypothetical protein